MTPPAGLSSAQVGERRLRGLTNAGGERASRSVAEILRANILTRFNLILGVLLAVILIAGQPQDALFGVVLVANALIGIGQELRAKRTLEKLAIVDDRRLKELSVGTFIYSAVFLTEGVGLALGKRWAEYLTIATTASLLPLEIYELAKHASIGKVLALVINLAVVVYLALELRRFPKRS